MTTGPGPQSTMRDTTTRRERWARLRRSLWQPPRAHGEQPRERVVGPLELFYDLAVVVLVAQRCKIATRPRSPEAQQEPSGAQLTVSNWPVSKVCQCRPPS
jgi:hypothetical protein